MAQVEVFKSRALDRLLTICFKVYGSDDHLANLLYNHETGRMIVETDKCKNPEIGELLPTHIDQVEQDCM